MQSAEFDVSFVHGANAGPFSADSETAVASGVRRSGRIRTSAGASTSRSCYAYGAELNWRVARSEEAARSALNGVKPGFGHACKSVIDAASARTGSSIVAAASSIEAGPTADAGITSLEFSSSGPSVDSTLTGRKRGRPSSASAAERSASSACDNGADHHVSRRSRDEPASVAAGDGSGAAAALSVAGTGAGAAAGIGAAAAAGIGAGAAAGTALGFGWSVASMFGFGTGLSRASGSGSSSLVSGASVALNGSRDAASAKPADPPVSPLGAALRAMASNDGAVAGVVGLPLRSFASGSSGAGAGAAGAAGLLLRPFASSSSGLSAGGAGVGLSSFGLGSSGAGTGAGPSARHGIGFGSVFGASAGGSTEMAVAASNSAASSSSSSSSVKPSGHRDDFIRAAEAALAMTGYMARVKAKTIFALTDRDLDALLAAKHEAENTRVKPLVDWLTQADDLLHKSTASPAQLQTIFQAFSHENLRMVTSTACHVLGIVAQRVGASAEVQLAASIGSLAPAQLTALIQLATHAELKSIADRAIQELSEARRPGAVVRYSATELQAACLRKFGGAPALAAKLAINASAAEQRAKAFAAAGKKPGRKAGDGLGRLHRGMRIPSSTRGATGAAGSLSGGAGAGGKVSMPVAGGAGRRSGMRVSRGGPPRSLAWLSDDYDDGEASNSDGLQDWDDYLDCVKCKRKAPIDCENRLCQRCCIADPFGVCSAHAENDADGY